VFGDELVAELLAKFPGGGSGQARGVALMKIAAAGEGVGDSDGISDKATGQELGAEDAGKHVEFTGCGGAEAGEPEAGIAEDAFVLV
jgi:hypothetical protein